MRTIRTRAQSTRTSSISGKSWNRILRSRVSFLPFMAVVINSLVEKSEVEVRSQGERSAGELVNSVLVLMKCKFFVYSVLRSTLS